MGRRCAGRSHCCPGRSGPPQGLRQRARPPPHGPAPIREGLQGPAPLLGDDCTASSRLQAVPPPGPPASHGACGGSMRRGLAARRACHSPFGGRLMPGRGRAGPGGRGRPRMARLLGRPAGAARKLLEHTHPNPNRPSPLHPQLVGALLSVQPPPIAAGPRTSSQKRGSRAAAICRRPAAFAAAPPHALRGPRAPAALGAPPPAAAAAWW